MELKVPQPPMAQYLAKREIPFYKEFIADVVFIQ